MVKRGLILGGVLAIISSISACNVFADETASSTFSIDVSAAALQVTAPSTASIVLNPTSSSAVFGSTNITVNVATNNATGYTITMSVSTTDLTHSTITGDNAPVIPTLQSAAPQSTFPANAWGYKVAGDNYNPVLLSNTNPSWATENPTNGTDHIISLAAKVDGVKQAGVYENTLTFNVVANPNATRDTIVFDKNNEDATGTMENQTAHQGIATKLNKNNFTLSGMRFAGWSTTASGTGEGVRYYGDESTITTDVDNSSKTITLYAQWTNLPSCANPSDCDVDPEHIPEGGTVGTTFQRAYEIAYTTMKKGMYEEQHEGQGDYALVNSWPPDNEPYKNYDVRFAMQDMTPEICASVTAIHDDYQALDIRDNKLYHITKMKDGSCWMTQNLDLNIISDANHPYTSLDTDLVEYDVGGYTSANGYALDGSTIKWTPSLATVSDKNDWNPAISYNYPQSMDVGDWYWIGNWLNGGVSTYYQYSNNYDYIGSGENDIFHQNQFTGNGQHGHVGNFYNWSAAIASNGSTMYGNSTYDSPQSSPHNSICPAGWRLPTITNHENNKNDFYRLVSLYSKYVDYKIDYELTAEPLWFLRSGNFSGVLNQSGVLGDYWSNTSGDTHWTGMQTAYSFEFSYTKIEPDYGSYGKGNGLTIRCLAR